MIIKNIQNDMIFLAVLFLLSVSSAHAAVVICNDSAETIRLAERWNEPMEVAGWYDVVEGWYYLEPGECFDEISGPTGAEMDLFAETLSGRTVDFGGGPLSGRGHTCVGDSEHFRLREHVYPGMCDELDGPYRSASYQRIGVGGNTVWRISLTIRVISGGGTAQCENTTRTITGDTGRGWGHQGTWDFRLPTDYQLCSYSVARQSANPRRDTFSVVGPIYSDDGYEHGVRINYNVPNLGNQGAAAIFGRGERSWLTIRVTLTGSTCACR